MRATCWMRQNNPGELPGCETLMANKIQGERRGRGSKRVVVSISNSMEGNSSTSEGKLQHDCTAHLPLPADLQAAPALSHCCSSQSQIKITHTTSQGYKTWNHNVRKVGIIRSIRSSSPAVDPAPPSCPPLNSVNKCHIPTFF